MIKFKFRRHAAGVWVVNNGYRDCAIIMGKKRNKNWSIREIVYDFNKAIALKSANKVFDNLESAKSHCTKNAYGF
jgi:hypothetical protein